MREIAIAQLSAELGFALSASCSSPSSISLQLTPRIIVISSWLTFHILICINIAMLSKICSLLTLFKLLVRPIATRRSSDEIDERHG